MFCQINILKLVELIEIVNKIIIVASIWLFVLLCLLRSIPKSWFLCKYDVVLSFSFNIR